MKKESAKNFYFLFLVTILLGLAACGYGTHRQDVVLGTNPKARQTLFIPMVDNTTTRSGVEAILTTALRETLANIHGVELVNHPEAASYLLLGTLTGYGRKSGVSSVTGSGASAARGGLAQDQITAAEIHLELTLQVKLIEKSGTDSAAPEVLTPLRKLVWNRAFAESATFETSRRFTEVLGASSTPYINDSREVIQVKALARKLARKIYDQVVQDF